MTSLAAFRYALTILRHKAFVFRAGLVTGAPLWRLVIHDWTKFGPAEFPEYCRRFHGEDQDPDAFRRAWHHHLRSSPHHWEYWVLSGPHSTTQDDPVDFIAMPDWAIREMLADWYGASRMALGRWPSRGSWPWIDANLEKVTARMDRATAERLAALLEATIDRLPRRREETDGAALPAR